jgi:hypothetical protein
MMPTLSRLSARRNAPGKSPLAHRGSPSFTFAVGLLVVASVFVTLLPFSVDQSPSKYNDLKGVDSRLPTSRSGDLPLLLQYRISFGESSLPTGSTWNVDLNGTVKISTGGWINFTAPSGRYPFQIGAPPGFTANPPSGTISINASNVSRSISFQPVTYSMTFTERGLPNGTYWVAIVNGIQGHSMSPTLTFSLQNGTYNYSVGQTGQFQPSPRNGTVIINGSARNLSIRFSEPTTYSVTFTQQGLVTGTYWSIWLGGATLGGIGTTLALNVSNGTYAYVASATDYVANDSAGNLTINGSTVGQTIYFTIAPYAVTFEEEHLPIGSTWEVTLNGLAKSGTGNLSFQEPNGSFAFRVDPVGHLLPDPATGLATVHGSNRSIAIVFGAPTYPVVFTATGLPSGTSWAIDLNGTAVRTTAGYLTFSESNGSYPYSVASVPGYLSPPNGTLGVSGNLSSVLVGFHQFLFSLTFHEVGLPNGTGWGVLIGNLSDSSVSSNVTFTLPDGSYGFVILSVTGYIDVISGPAQVSGSNSVIVIPFREETYPITFVQFGLPPGSNWSVTVSNATSGLNETQHSQTNSITFFLPNGTYLIGFVLPPGFTGNASSTSLTVAGLPGSGGVLTVAPSSTVGGSLSSPSAMNVEFLVAVGSIVGAVGMLALLSGLQFAQRSQDGNPFGVDQMSPYQPYRRAVEEEVPRLEQPPPEGGM